MRHAWKLGRLAGIDVFIHATLWLTLGLLGVSAWLAGASLPTILGGLSLMIAVFGCVLLHEFGHALTARRFGIATKDIVLSPIGGVARLERMPRKPGQEVVVALAGPAVNVGIALLLAGVVFLTNSSAAWQLERLAESFAGRLLVANVLVAALNLLPAFPLDGGRVLRALLSIRFGRRRATRAAVFLGRTLCVGLALLGLVQSPMLILIAVFLWIAGTAELRAVEMTSEVAGRRLHELFVPPRTVLFANHSLGAAALSSLRNGREAMPVVDSGYRLLGVLPHPVLMRAVTQFGFEPPVSEFMETEFRQAAPEELIDSCLPKILAGEGPLFVVEDQRLLGTIGFSLLGRFVELERALTTHQESRGQSDSAKREGGSRGVRS